MSNAIMITNHGLKLMILQAVYNWQSVASHVGTAQTFPWKAIGTTLLRAPLGDFGAWMLLWLSFPLALCQFLPTHLL